MGLVRRGYLSISEAYEKIVATLEPHARPSDDYLLSLDEDERDEAFDSAHDAEKRAEKLFADALANKQLTRWRMLNDGTMERWFASASSRNGSQAISAIATADVRQGRE
jgi:hypothetical protein